MDKTIKVTNTSRNQIFRGGYTFQPEKTETITISAQGYKEVKACSLLKIAAPEQDNVCEICGFIAKSPGGLRFHRKKHEGKKVKE